MSWERKRILTQYVALRHPLANVKVRRLVGYRVVLPLPQNALLELADRVQNCLALLLRQRLGAHHRAEADVDDAELGCVEEILQFLTMNVLRQVKVNESRITHRVQWIRFPDVNSAKLDDVRREMFRPAQ